ncbi:Uncharacterized protein FWK35_00005908 [Aphis craccivora]|uniref:Uncharacterized protein n=1 Tax=Aphis craccivora TaxID=307492 RepID=A0A6G0ZMK8_APHCR|nr:Uncharacterized protein FWK35_00005908 [Aphis craccivora]
MMTLIIFHNLTLSRTEENDLNINKFGKKRKISFKKRFELLEYISPSYPPAFNIGDTLRVSLPDVDIGRADLRNIISAVWSIEDGQYYKLGNKYGTLPHLISDDVGGHWSLVKYTKGIHVRRNVIPIDHFVQFKMSWKHAIFQISLVITNCTYNIAVVIISLFPLFPSILLICSLLNKITFNEHQITIN